MCHVVIYLNRMIIIFLLMLRFSYIYIYFLKTSAFSNYVHVLAFYYDQPTVFKVLGIQLVDKWLYHLTTGGKLIQMWIQNNSKGHRRSTTSWLVLISQKQKKNKTCINVIQYSYVTFQIITKSRLSRKKDHFGIVLKHFVLCYHFDCKASCFLYTYLHLSIFFLYNFLHNLPYYKLT